jgi:amino-acid racemase
MAGPVYAAALGRLGIEALVPEPPDFESVDRIIFAELVDGIFRDESRQTYNRAIARLAARGCDAVALACTEIPLVVWTEESPLPTPARRPSPTTMPADCGSAATGMSSTWTGGAAASRPT